MQHIPRTLQELETVKRLVHAERLRRSFREFVKSAWHVAEPASTYIDNWHIHAIADHLQAVAKGEIRKLVINIPPGHAKSLLAAVLWPAWVWTWRPTWRGLFCSYAANLATRDSVRTRSTIESDWYRDLFLTDASGKITWGLKTDQNAKDLFENTETGFRQALGVGGKGTGYRGNCVLVDDPINASDAPSKAARDEAIFWWDQQMSSRVNDPKTDAFVIIMQRLHEVDLSGHVLEQGGYEHLCLPSEFDPKRVSTTKLGVADQRAEGQSCAGEKLLFPQLFPQEVLEDAKVTLGSAGYSGQHDQKPMPSGGGLFKRNYWRFWRYKDSDAGSRRPLGCNEYPPKEIEPSLKKTYWDTIVISVDCSFKGILEAKGPDPDYVVILVIATKGADRFLLHRFRKQIGFKETCKELKNICKMFPRAFRKLIEDKANGSAVIETLKTEVSGIIAVQPEGGKEARANAIAPSVEAGNSYLPEGAEWLEEWIAEFASFPRGRHDDQVDAYSQALIVLETQNANRTRMLVGHLNS